MEMLCISCQLVIAVCTLLYLFSLQQSIEQGREGEEQEHHRRREIALGFLSLGFTVAVLAVMVIGTARLVRGARATWLRLSGRHDSILSAISATTQPFGPTSYGSVVPEVGGCEVGEVGPQWGKQGSRMFRNRIPRYLLSK